MLSRIAESLFWIGRYTHRAEATARMLKAQLRMLVEEPWNPASETCRGLLILMGVPDHAWGDGEPDHEDLITLLGYDRLQPSSVVSCWEAVRDNARRAREVIPTELWELINTTWQRLPRASAPAMRSQNFLDWAVERGALFTGISRGAMVRDDGWRFLMLGRSLEQADMTARMVASASISTASAPWATVLRSCGAHDAFLRTYRGFRAGDESAAFLTTDQRFPRAIMHAVTNAVDSLQALDRSYGVADDRSARTGQFELRRLLAHLEVTPIDALVGELGPEMGQVLQTCDRATQMISDTFFNSGGEVAWKTEESH